MSSKNNINVIVNNFRKYISNLPGWRTKRKLVVIESDDWGSIRMPNKVVRKNLLEKGIIDENSRCNRFDSLATKKDLEFLFNVIQDHRDQNGNPAVFTFLTITSNPNFDKIKESNFSKYFFEAFPATLNKYYNDSDQIMQSWSEGINSGLIRPQFHGREHLNVAEWMRSLRNKDKTHLIAFDYNFWGLSMDEGKNSRISSFQAAFDLYDTEDLKIQAQSIKEGLEIFESLFGYNATFFVPPNGPFNNLLEKTASANGIRYISKAKRQIEPLGYGKVRTVYHKIGQKNKWNQIYMTRNCIFEPSLDGRDWVSSCLNDIKIAFRMRKPAVISTHRVNFIGALEPANRDRGLSQLDQLLKEITKQWPDVEFITSDQLGDIVAEDIGVNWS